MFSSRAVGRIVCLLALLASLTPSGRSANEPETGSRFPFQQTLTYRIEWHMVNAGTATMEYKRMAGNKWQVNLTIESAGLVNRLYHVADKYTVNSDERFCPENATMDGREGNRHITTQLTFDQVRHTVDYREHDWVKNTQKEIKLDTVDCTREISGALAALSLSTLPVGQATTVPITNGKRFVNARIESQAREKISIDGKNYSTIRYQAFLFDNVLYKRHGRLFIWVTDDPERTPVQMRLEIGFPVGNVLLQLEKQQKF